MELTCGALAGGMTALLETRRKRFAKALQYYDEALTIRKQHDTTAAVCTRGLGVFVVVFHSLTSGR